MTIGLEARCTGALKVSIASSFITVILFLTGDPSDTRDLVDTGYLIDVGDLIDAGDLIDVGGLIGDRDIVDIGDGGHKDTEEGMATEA